MHKPKPKWIQVKHDVTQRDFHWVPPVAFPQATNTHRLTWSTLPWQRTICNLVCWSILTDIKKKGQIEWNLMKHYVTCDWPPQNDIWYLQKMILLQPFSHSFCVSLWHPLWSVSYTLAHPRLLISPLSLIPSGCKWLLSSLRTST